MKSRTFNDWTIALVLCPILSLAQGIQWNTAPHKGFVFQISNDEAQKLLTRYSSDTVFKSLLHTQVDTFDVRKGWISRPGQGHFIVASVAENKLHCEYTSVFPYQVFLMRDYNTLSLQVLDFDGNVREDALVRVKRKKVKIDTESKTYRLAAEWFSGSERFVTVEWAGFRSVFNVTKHPGPESNYHWSYDEGPDFYSYMITDKNRYRPNETVRYKSFALNGSRFPLRKTLEVWVTTYRSHKKVGTIEPHRPGSYAGEFQLSDSLKLMLDQRYNLQLKEKNGRTVSTCAFQYADYELNGDKVELHLSSLDQFHPAKNELTILATDVNGLVLKGAHATVVVETQSIRETFQPLVILRDTLMLMEIDLNPREATVVDIPSHVFEKTNTGYKVHVTVRNSQNKMVEGSVAGNHYYAQNELRSRYSNDSIVFEYYRNGVLIVNAPFELRYDEDVEARTVMLPYKEKINPARSMVRLTNDSVFRAFDMSRLLPKLELKGGIAADSLHLFLENPQKQEIAWFLYQGQTLVRKGFGKTFKLDTLITDRSETYYAELVYSYGGEDHLIQKEYQFQDDWLNVSLQIPERVYPGQKAEANILVTNGQGLPVGNVDLTAVGVTGKLNYYLPDLPYYGTSSSPRDKKATFSKANIRNRMARLDLDYPKWRKRAGLDTMLYYQFTYPDGMFAYAQPIQDSTQFAPFVMQRGMANRIYVIELNRVPVYFSWADQPDQYSFYVPADKNVFLTLRLFDRVLLFDSICFARGHKTLLSIDLDRLPPFVHTMMIPQVLDDKNRLINQFTEIERSRYRNYLCSFRFRPGNSYLEQGSRFIPLFNENDSPQHDIIAGPIPSGEYTLMSNEGEQKITYRHEGNYAYEFNSNVVYKRNDYNLYLWSLSNLVYQPMGLVNDLAMTREKFLQPSPRPQGNNPRVIYLLDPALQMTVQLPKEEAQSGFAGIYFVNCSTGKVTTPCQINTGKRNEYYNIPRGCQRIVALFANGTRLEMDSVFIRSYSKIVVDLNEARLLPADTTSARLKNTSADCYPRVERRVISMRTNARQPGNVRGTVYASEDGGRLPGVNVVVKGTSNGTITDEDGEFALYIDQSYATLVFSFIGYATVEVEVGQRSIIDVSMDADVQMLTEVVVTAQGISQDKRALGYSVSYVDGRETRVAVKDEVPATADEEPDQEEYLEGERRLYRELLQLNSIRSNFRDVAFWEPKLYTDKHGMSRFPVTFPDDITRWEATVYAMNRKLQTGTGRGVIKSYKPIMAELHTPQFLTVGDSSNFIGKVSNYSDDGLIKGKVNWGGTERAVQFSEFTIDQIPVYATAPDSIAARYVFTRDDGYLDGEERKVPVVEQGIVRAEGTLSILQNQEKIEVKAAPGEHITVSLMARPIEIFAGEARYLMSYKYDCNEQLASKLAGLINYQMLMRFEGKPFRYDKEVNKIITRLLRNQNEEFLWSWWDVSPNTTFWISSHVLRSLRAAADAGYTVNLDVANLTRKVEYKFNFLNRYTLDDADLLNALSAWDAKLDYARHIQKLDVLMDSTRKDWARLAKKSRRKYSYSLLEETLLLQEIRLQRNLAYQRDTLLKYEKKGILGDTHFSDGRSARWWHYDELSANMIAYRIIKKDSILRDRLARMQLYILGDRARRCWNTYHSSSVLMNILPDLIGEGASSGHAARVKLSGKVNATVEAFPYLVELNPGESVTIDKESGIPIFAMKYVMERVTVAKTGVEGFEIATKLGNNGKLEAGKPVNLTVEISVKKVANLEYVMIEVPIPGSCSYGDKDAGVNRVETHREYFRERTVIFCQNITSGTYRFNVNLLPRFTGSYVVNPSQVSLMYVPVVNANTGMRKVKVE